MADRGSHGGARAAVFCRILRAGGVEVIMTKCVQVKHALTAQNRLGSDMVCGHGRRREFCPSAAPSFASISRCNRD